MRPFPVNQIGKTATLSALLLELSRFAFESHYGNVIIRPETFRKLFIRRNPQKITIAIPRVSTRFQ